MERQLHDQPCVGAAGTALSAEGKGQFLDPREEPTAVPTLEVFDPCLSAQLNGTEPF